jgi:hypothetical protein
MEQIPLSSTNIAYAGYDESTLTLQITFRSGGVYQYANVEPQTYQDMMASGDPGKYFAQIIKPQRVKYSFVRIA